MQLKDFECSGYGRIGSEVVNICSCICLEKKFTYKSQIKEGDFILLCLNRPAVRKGFATIMPIIGSLMLHL